MKYSRSARSFFRRCRMHHINAIDGNPIRSQCSGNTHTRLIRKEHSGAVKLGTISTDDWRLVLEFETRCKVLELAETGGWPAVEEFLCELRSRKRTSEIHF